MMPNFFIVGAARSGTTSLDRYLGQHPEIYITPKKETHFFAAGNFPESFTGPGDERLNRRLIRDEERYDQLFTGVVGEKAIGESSVFYLCYPASAERIARAVPEAKIIILLREPVARTYSSYIFLLRDGRETSGFEEGLNLEKERKEQGFEPMWWYKELSQYYSQVQHYLDVFGAEQVKVLLYEELYANPDQVLRDVFAFLKVREDVAIDTSVRYNLSGVPKSRRLYNLLDHFIDKPSFLERRLKSLIPLDLRVAWASKIIGMFTHSVPINPQIQAQLRMYFAEDVGKLEDLLHRDLSGWHYQKPSLAQQS
jgi:hypothetical protein